MATHMSVIQIEFSLSNFKRLRVCPSTLCLFSYVTNTYVIYAYIDTCLHAHTYMYTYIHSYIDTYIYTYACT